MNKVDTQEKRDYIKSLVEKNTQIRFVNVTESSMYIDGYIDFDTMREIVEYIDRGCKTREASIMECFSKMRCETDNHRREIVAELAKKEKFWAKYAREQGIVVN